MLVKVIKKRMLFIIMAISSLVGSFGAVHAAKLDSTHIGNGAKYRVLIQTSKGPIVFDLLNETPRHRDNFVKLAGSGFYDQILFHRVIKGFMIQTGDPTSRDASAVKVYGDNDAGYKLDAEISPRYYHKQGAVAAAREGDANNPTRQSSSSQFYIVTGKQMNDSLLSVARDRIKQQNGAEITPEREKVYRTKGGAPHLDGSYTIFGEVVHGMGNVEQIAKLARDTRDRPVDDTFIKSVTVKIVRDRKRDR